MKQTILGIGFIGFQLMKDIANIMTDEDELFLVDNDKINLQRAVHALEMGVYNQGAIHVLEGDVRYNSFKEIKYFHLGKVHWRNDYSFESLLTDSIVYNLSARVGVKSWNENAYLNYFHNFQVDNNVAEMIKQYKCKKYIYASSSEVLGNGENLKESDDFKISNSPRGLYALEKLHGETLAKTLGVPYSVVRFFNIVGPYQDINKGVFPKFMKEMLFKTETVKASDDIRCFCDVRDASGALIALSQNNDSQTVNVCNPKNTFTMYELAQTLKNVLKSSVEIEHIKDGFIQKRIGDNSELLKYLKYYKIKYNIFDIINYFMKELNSNGYC